MLEEEFERTHYPCVTTRERLAQITSLSEARVQVRSVKTISFILKYGVLLYIICSPKIIAWILFEKINLPQLQSKY